MAGCAASHSTAHTPAGKEADVGLGTASAHTIDCAGSATPCMCAGPDGVEGWRPEDYQRQGGRRGGPPDVHPDIGPPPPGRGSDWDSMFG